MINRPMFKSYSSEKIKMNVEILILVSGTEFSDWLIEYRNMSEPLLSSSNK